MVAIKRSWIDCLINPRQRARLKPCRLAASAKLRSTRCCRRLRSSLALLVLACRRARSKRAAHVVQKQQQHHFHDHGWVFRNVAFGSVEVRHFFPDKIELEQFIEFAQRMIAADSFIQVDAVTPKLLLPISAPHHIEARFYQISNCHSYIILPLFGQQAVNG
jgi:hypothetical protein